MAASYINPPLAYVKTAIPVQENDYALYLKVAEELNLTILEIVEGAGARLALPSQTLYLEQEVDRNVGKEPMKG